MNAVSQSTSQLTLQGLLSPVGITESWLYSTPQSQATRPNLTLIAPDIVAVWPESIALTDQLAVVICCGLHGNETAPIEITAQLLDEIKSGQQTVSRPTLFIFGNRAAMLKGTRDVDYDLNRLIGKKDRNPAYSESTRAGQIESALCVFLNALSTRYQRTFALLSFDLHTAIRASQHERFALLPNPNQLGWNWVKECQLDAVIIDKLGGYKFTHYVAKLQHPALESVAAFTCELGKVRPFGSNDLNSYGKITQALRKACSGGTPEPDRNVPKLYKILREVIKSSDDFVLNVADGVENFSALAEGYVLAQDGTHQEIVDETNCCLIFPKKIVAIGERAGILVIPIAATSLCIES